MSILNCFKFGTVFCSLKPIIVVFTPVLAYRFAGFWLKFHIYRFKDTVSSLIVFTTCFPNVCSGQVGLILQQLIFIRFGTRL